MRAFPVASVLFLSLSTFPYTAEAITLSELPASIQSCIGAGNCVVGLGDAYSSGSASAFAMIDPSTGKQDWLMRYALVPPSGESDSEGAQTSIFGGYLWMQVAASYNAAEAQHAVTLFLDKVTPVPGSYIDQDGDLSLYMTSTDLLGGSAYRTMADPGYGDYDAGNLSGEIPLICLAEGCQIDAQLNLLQLDYANTGASIVMTGFDASDMRGLVYSQGSYYFDGDPPYGTTQAFYVSAIPEPGAAWLFGFGLLGVGAVARHRRAGADKGWDRAAPDTRRSPRVLPCHRDR